MYSFTINVSAPSLGNEMSFGLFYADQHLSVDFYSFFLPLETVFRWWNLFTVDVHRELPNPRLLTRLRSSNPEHRYLVFVPPCFNKHFPFPENVAFSLKWSHKAINFLQQHGRQLFCLLLVRLCHFGGEVNTPLFIRRKQKKKRAGLPIYFLFLFFLAIRGRGELHFKALFFSKLHFQSSPKGFLRNQP